MSEQLLNIDEVASRLRVVRKTVQRHIYKLRSKGLREVRFGTRSVRFLESSLDHMIRQAAKRGDKLFD